jgi:hypothetical protein
MSTSETHPDDKPSSRTRFHAFLVASGILLSRIAGLIRVSVFAYFFGNSDAADAFNAAFRIPNILQNLFGEGVLSASFIPVYANLLARNDKKEAQRVAGAVAALLGLVTSILVLIGETGAHHPAGADILPGRGPARLVSLVPGHIEQPRKVFSIIHGAGHMERDDHPVHGAFRMECAAV